MISDQISIGTCGNKRIFRMSIVPLCLSLGGRDGDCKKIERKNIRKTQKLCKIFKIDELLVSVFENILLIYFSYNFIGNVFRKKKLINIRNLRV